MSYEIVAICTYQREELLWLCLESIRAQDAKIPILVSSDRGARSEDLTRTCAEFKAGYIVQESTRGFGNSFNVLTTLELAVRSGASIVHSIEDDTIIHPGYLEWARKSLATGRYAAVCGHVGNEIDTWYTSPCASWDAVKLQEALRLVPLGYFAETREEMQKIADTAFPHSKYRFGSCEQDGLHLRIIEFFKWRTRFPEKPLCVHLGHYGYNRPGGTRPAGNLRDRIQACRDLLASKTRRVALFGQRIVELEMEEENR